MKTISLEISNEFDRRLRIVAAQMDLNRSEFIRQVLEKQLTTLQESVDERRDSSPVPASTTCAAE